MAKIKDIIPDKEINLKEQIENIIRIQSDIIHLIKNEDYTTEILNLFIKEYFSNNFKINQIY